MAIAAHPLRGLRLVSLFLVWAMAVALIGIIPNAEVKTNDQVDRVQQVADATVPGTNVDVNHKEMTRPGIAVLVCALFTFIHTLAFILVLLLKKGAPSLTAKAEAGLLLISTLWYAGSLGAFTNIWQNKGAIVRAFLNGVQLPQTIVDSVAASNGFSTAYEDQWYLRAVVIAGWIAFCLTLFAAVLSTVAATRKPAQSGQAVSNGDVRNEREKV